MSAMNAISPCGWCCGCLCACLAFGCIYYVGWAPSTHMYQPSPLAFSVGPMDRMSLPPKNSHLSSSIDSVMTTTTTQAENYDSAPQVGSWITSFDKLLQDPLGLHCFQVGTLPHTPPTLTPHPPILTPHPPIHHTLTALVGVCRHSLSLLWVVSVVFAFAEVPQQRVQ